MSTCNFHNRHAKHIYAIEIENEFDYDDVMHNAQYLLEEAVAKKKEIIFSRHDEWDNHALRSYDSKIFAEFTYVCPETDASFDMRMLLTNGYYSGVNLDYYFDCEGSGHSDIAEALDEYEYFLKTYYPEMEESEVNKLKKVAENKMNEMTDIAEAVFAKMSTPLNCVGVFSNGEAVYEKA